MTSVEPNVDQGGKEKRKRRFGARTSAEEALEGIDLTGRTVLITGSTHGIGKETAKQLAHKGAHVVMANRNQELAEQVRKEIKGDNDNIQVDLLQLDLSSLESVKECAEEFLKQGWPLHILILNAGIISSPEKQTKNGFSSVFGVNHLGHFYLTSLLKEKLLESAPARVVVLSSGSHRHTGISPAAPIEEKVKALTPGPDTTVNGYRQYALSKLCNVLFGFKLHRDLFDKGVIVNVVHPGNMVQTNIASSYGLLGKFAYLCVKPFTKNMSQGASTSVYCAVHPDLNEVGGRYFESCWDDDSNLAGALANDVELQDALWEKSVQLIEQAGFTV
uniref:NAD(P)-binding protein n=2 Tax=Bursaphelenchus xylophilus TaxID=6326 RepID=A0A1I7SLH3_BURXY